MKRRLLALFAVLCLLLPLRVLAEGADGGDIDLGGMNSMGLEMTVVQVVDDRNVIIRLSRDVFGSTDAGRYTCRTLNGEEVSILRAQSAFAELGGTMTNVFRLTLAGRLQSGVAYLLEARNMALDAGWSQVCGAARAVFTPGDLPSSENVSVLALTNNQSVNFQLPAGVSGRLLKENYVICSSAGTQVSVGNVEDLGNDRVKVNFTDPLPADVYTLTSRNMSTTLVGSFAITLHLGIFRIEQNSVIVQLSAPVYGCTEPWSYFVHKLGDSREITAVKAESVFVELGGEYPDVFRITLPEDIVPGQTYIIETRRMALDVNWNQPCQGTIGYFTK